MQEGEAPNYRPLTEDSPTGTNGLFQAPTGKDVHCISYKKSAASGCPTGSVGGVRDFCSWGFGFEPRIVCRDYLNIKLKEKSSLRHMRLRHAYLVFFSFLKSEAIIVFSVKGTL